MIEDVIDFVIEFVLFPLAFLAAVVAGTGGLVGGIRALDHHYGVSSCHSFAAQSGYETKWADYNFLYYECLAKTNNGKWVPTDSLRGVNQ